MGTFAYRTLARLINSFCRESLEIKSIGGLNPYFLTFKLPKDKFDNIYPEIISLCEQIIIPEHLVSEAKAPEIEKYNRFISYPLLWKAFVADYLNLDEVRDLVILW